MTRVKVVAEVVCAVKDPIIHSGFTCGIAETRGSAPFPGFEFLSAPFRQKRRQCGISGYWTVPQLDRSDRFPHSRSAQFSPQSYARSMHPTICVKASQSVKPRLAYRAKPNLNSHKATALLAERHVFDCQTRHGSSGKRLQCTCTLNVSQRSTPALGMHEHHRSITKWHAHERKWDIFPRLPNYGRGVVDV